MDEQDKIIQSEEPSAAEPIKVRRKRTKAVEKPADEGEVIPVKVRESVKASIKRAAKDAQEFERLSAEMNKPLESAPEEQIKPVTVEAPQAKTSSKFSFKLPPQHRRLLRPHPEQVSDDEKMWAALAHGSALLTILVGIATGGLGSLLTIFVPLMIYIGYRNKSEFVAHHALQAFAAQVAATIGFVVLLLTIGVVWVALIVISALLILVLIGLILLPLVLLAGVFALAATFLLPLGLLVYGIIAAVEAWNGHNYSYPWIGDWVDDQLYGSIDKVL